MQLEAKNRIAEALKLHQSGNLDEAENSYIEILNDNPKNADALNLLGLLKLQNKHFEDAILNIKKAIEIMPCSYFCENLGRAYYENKDYEKAIVNYKKVLELEPRNFNALFNIALAYKADLQYQNAIDAYNAALEVKPNHPDIYFNLGNIYENMNDTEKALDYYKLADKYKTGNSNSLLSNIDYFLSVSYLKLKNFKDGWHHYEYRPCKEFSIRTQELQLQELMDNKPIWSGEPIADKTLFVYYEAGLGDSIMYARYFPLLKERCAKVIFKPQLCLASFFRENDLGAQIVDINTPKEQMQFDLHLPIMSIPYVLQLNTEDAPYSEGFLKSNPNKVQEYKQKYFNNNKFKIGIKWQGNPAYDRNRIVPLEAFYKLFELPNTQFYSLQKDDGAEELEKVPSKYEIIDLGPSFNDFSDTAAAIENLDLVICNDTSVAHLVGAMGKACWILLPFVSNWRWYNDMTYSPWYDSVKLFKQARLDNWDNVIDDVYSELKITLDI